MNNDTKASPNIRRDISLKLTVMTRQMRVQFDKHVAQTGLTRSQWSLIAVVSRRPGASQRAIAAILEMTEASAGRLIDRLCSEGLLERRQHADDRRTWCVYLTDAALPLLDKISLVATDLETSAFAGMSDEDLVRFQDQLDLICKNLGFKRELG